MHRHWTERSEASMSTAGAGQAPKLAPTPAGHLVRGVCPIHEVRIGTLGGANSACRGTHCEQATTKLCWNNVRAVKHTLKTDVINV